MSRHEYTGKKNLEIKSKLGKSTAEPSGKIDYTGMKVNPGSNTHHKHMFTIKPFDINNKIVEHRIYKHGGKLSKPTHEHVFTHVMSNKSTETLLKQVKPFDEEVSKDKKEIKPKVPRKPDNSHEDYKALFDYIVQGDGRPRKEPEPESMQTGLLDKAPKGGVCYDRAFLTAKQWQRFCLGLAKIEEAIGMTRLGYTITEGPSIARGLPSYNMYYKRISTAKESAFRTEVRKLWSKSPGNIPMK